MKMAVEKPTTTEAATKRVRHKNGDKPNGERGEGGRLNGRRDSSQYDRFMKEMADALGALANGNFSVRLPSDWIGMEGRVADRFNEIAGRMEHFNTGLLRVRHQVGE